MFSQRRAALHDAYIYFQGHFFVAIQSLRSGVFGLWSDTESAILSEFIHSEVEGDG